MVYEKVIELCKQKHISVSRLEKECGLGNATIRGWAVSSPRIDRIKPVADYFGVTVDELISESK